jgi:hypothetical protein
VAATGARARRSPSRNRILPAGSPFGAFRVPPGGDFTAYYNDDMFYNHAVTVYGNVEDGLKLSTIEG